VKLLREKKTKLHCEYWRPIAMTFRLPRVLP
jgi:hypothetical protein